MSLQSLSKTNSQNSSNIEAGSKADNFFDTSHLKADIKGHSVRGGVVTVTSQGLKFILRTGSTTILARLLTPEDFGLIAMVSVFTEFVNLFKDLGLSMATIQKKDITHKQVSTLFWINIAVSCFLMLVTIMISPLVAWFYGEPRLLLITIAIGGTFIFGGLVAQHTALMRRQMRFRTIEIIEIISLSTGIVAAIIAALSGLSYWALVVMMAVKGLTYVICVWRVSKWRPDWPGRSSGVRSMLAFGGSLTGSNILGYFSKNSDNLIIGYALGPAVLGIYAKAYGLLTLPMSQLNWPLRSVMIPSLSRLQDEPKQYCRFFLQALSAIAIVAMPVAAFLFVAADEIVDILLGSQWKAVVVTFRCLAPAAFLSTISFAPSWLFISLGRAGTQLRIMILGTPITVIGFLIGVNWGINGVAISFSITWTSIFIISIIWACYKSPIEFYDICKALIVPVFSSLLSAAGAGFSRIIVLESNIIVRLAVSTLVFVFCYFICVIATPAGRRIIRSMINALSALRKKPVTPVIIDR